MVREGLGAWGGLRQAGKTEWEKGKTVCSNIQLLQPRLADNDSKPSSPEDMRLNTCVPQCCRVSLVIEMFVRMLHHCGMPVDDVDLIHGNGKVVGEILQKANVRSTLFTGSAKVAETLAVQLRGKVGSRVLQITCMQLCPLNHMYAVTSSESCVCSCIL